MVLSLNLTLKEKALQYKARTGDVASFGRFTATAGMAMSDIKSALCDEMLEVQGWRVSTKGRVAYGYIPCIKRCLASPWLTPGHYMSQTLTGHGNFKQRLHDLGLVNSSLCSCGLADTVEHILFFCENFINIRQEFIIVRGHGMNWPPILSRLINEEIFNDFSVYVAHVLRERPV